MRSVASLWGLAIVCALSSVGCGSDSDDAQAPADQIEYLALGDSIAYGENLFIPDTKAARPNDDAFVGYPELIGPEVFDGHYANLACPGATTASYLSLDGVDNGCRDFQKKWGNTLHVAYTGTQADKATEILRSNQVKVVTIGLGGNDLLHALHECSDLTPDDPDAALSCAIAALPQVIKDGKANMQEIIDRIREDFTGELIYVNVYSTYLTTDAATLGIGAWNTNMSPLFEDADGETADAFAAFSSEADKAGGDPCAAGLLIPNPEEGGTPPCDIHPSEKGARLLADTVEAVPGFSP
jgi:lysophospholipase L1-like esterase